MKPCRSVLYVDDDPDICQVVRASLGLMAGLRVHTAGSGEAAIDLAFELQPDLILMDVMMPGLDGPSTLKRIRNSPAIDAIPVIFLTAKVLPAEVDHLLHLGAIGVIGKPFDPLKLGSELMALWETAAGLPTAHCAQAAVKDQVNSLSEDFLRRTRNDVARLTTMFEGSGWGDPGMLKGAERLAHSIHGAGAMFGFPQLSAAAEVIERLVGEIVAAPPPLAGAHPARLRLLDCAQKLAHEAQIAGVGAVSVSGSST
jgi:CheY-like chemotaxis protein